MEASPYLQIEAELNKLEQVLQQSIDSEVELATEVSSYIVNSGGKRIRPTLTVLIAKALNYQGQELINLASAIELLHTATLIHDDVVDQSEIRRGKKSIHNKWDNAHGVLVGDFVYSKAFQLMASLSDKRLIQTLADSTNRISEGEVMQLNFLESSAFKESMYFEIISRKTAELFKAATVTAAILSRVDERMINTAGEFGFSLGIAFQLRDDLLDYSGKETKTGKKIGKDFLEGKVTLPLIKALELTDDKESDFLKSAFNKGDTKDLPQVIQIIEKSGAIEVVQKETEDYTYKCLNLLDKFDKSIYKESLKAIVFDLKERAT